MEWLNYHHLRYFWAAAREGSVTRASEKLHISQPAVTAQIRTLEQALGEKLFTRSGRSLALTEAGRVVYRYAEEIFGLGTELMEALKGQPTGRPACLAVGITNVIPKLIAYRLLEPALKLPEPVRVECREDRLERLLAELATHGLDLVLADAPAAPTVRVRAYSHLLGECGVSIFGVERLAKAHRRGFPRSLSPLGRVEALAFRRQLQHGTARRWLREQSVQPCRHLIAERQAGARRLPHKAFANRSSVAVHTRHRGLRSLSSRRQPTLTHFQWSVKPSASADGVFT